jgi:hypothetical protein
MIRRALNNISYLSKLRSLNFNRNLYSTSEPNVKNTLSTSSST